MSPLNQLFSYNAEGGIFIHCLGFIHHVVIIIGKGEHRGLNVDTVSN